MRMNKTVFLSFIPAVTVLAITAILGWTASGIFWLPSQVGAARLIGAAEVVGHGPERPVIEKLARAFEKANIGTAIYFKWNRTYDSAEMVKAKEADIAITALKDPDLTATPIAWDGIAAIVHFSNPVKEVTSQQLRDLFSGKIRSWSELHERGEGSIALVRRPDDQNVNVGFEQSLALDGKVPQNAKEIRTDQKVLNYVSGHASRLAYVSLGAAQEAVKYGTPIRILLVDGVEPAEPTLTSGQYKIRRPVLMLTRKDANPVAKAFIEFARTPAGQKILEEMYTHYSP